MRAFLAVAAALALSLGCSCGGASAAGGGTQATGGGSSIPTSTAQVEYDVHEWGLVRAGQGDVLRVGAVGPARPVRVLTIDKPVLYFHTSEPLTLDWVNVQMPAGGRVLEAWPLVPFGSSARWERVQIDPSGACTPSPLPSATEPPCASLPVGVECESTSLRRVRTTDAACVHVGAAQERFLFYRAEATRFTPPLVFERTQVPGQVQVRNAGSEPIPGLLVRILSEGTWTRTLAVAPPAPGASVLVGADFEVEASDHPVQSADETMLALPASIVAPATDAIREAMLGLGMTQAEAEVFLASWSPALFPEGAPVALDSLTAGDGDDAPEPSESFLYFLPEPSTEGVASLSFQPPPRAVRRAIAVWSSVP